MFRRAFISHHLHVESRQEGRLSHEVDEVVVHEVLHGLPSRCLASLALALALAFDTPH